MTPQPEPTAAEFRKALYSSIRGIFAVELDKFHAPLVVAEFRKIVREPVLVANDGVMDNLMFVVRKKDILELRPDVLEALRNLSLKPHAELSALKTAYALGNDQDRLAVDERFARRLFDAIKNSDGVPEGPFLRSAELVGGGKTLSVLKALLPDATARQREAEAKVPVDFLRVSALDQVRASIANQAFILTRKLTILSAPEPRRTADLLELYRSNAGPLGAWGYRELARHPSSGRIDVIRRAPVAVDVLVLLRELKGSLTLEETKLLEEKSFPPPDWEAVLDSQ